MENTKFTPGEWSPCCKNTNPHFIFADEYTTICRMMINDPDSPDYEPLQGNVTKEQLIANAKLIAAAPKLLKALLTFVERQEKGWHINLAWNNDTKELIKEAIEAAGGIDVISESIYTK